MWGKTRETGEFNKALESFVSWAVILSSHSHLPDHTSKHLAEDFKKYFYVWLSVNVMLWYCHDMSNTFSILRADLCHALQTLPSLQLR